MLRAVTLDFWNTLFVDTRAREREQLRERLVSDALEPLGVRPDHAALADALRGAWDHFDQVWVREHRTPTCRELVDVVLSRFPARPDEAGRARLSRAFEDLLLEAPPEPIPGVVHTLPLLAGRYRLAVICDTGFSPGRVLRELLARHGLLRYFAYTFFSNEHGVSKPDPEAFKLTLAELGVAAYEAAHVGDLQRTDIAGAQQAGMSAVHFIGANNHDAPRSTADLLVRHFDELPEALGGLTCAGC